MVATGALRPRSDGGGTANSIRRGGVAARYIQHSSCVELNPKLQRERDAARSEHEWWMQAHPELTDGRTSSGRKKSVPATLAPCEGGGGRRQQIGRGRRSRGVGGGDNLPPKTEGLGVGGHQQIGRGRRVRGWGAAPASYPRQKVEAWPS
uniref:Uncharacterized protein n=1 Tax=Oryza meridionalis TaxID=40149 RepID=A0A0E0E0T7_9ORYZ